jgi:hypothetical protein
MLCLQRLIIAWTLSSVRDFACECIIWFASVNERISRFDPAVGKSIKLISIGVIESGGKIYENQLLELKVMIYDTSGLFWQFTKYRWISEMQPQISEILPRQYGGFCLDLIGSQGSFFGIQCVFMV